MDFIPSYRVIFVLDKRYENKVEVGSLRYRFWSCYALILCFETF